MKRKTLLAISLSLSLALTLMVNTAFAAGGISTGGTIHFAAYDGGGLEVIDPGEKGELPDKIPDVITPLTPDEEDKLKYLDSIGLNFGHDLKILDTNNVYRSKNQTGMLVNANSNWAVSVRISGFHHDDGGEVLKAFTLTLTPAPNEDYGYAVIRGAEIKPNAVTIYAANDGQYGDARRIATGSAGFMGCNFDGDLFVPANSARAGNATATIEWNISVTA